MSLVIQATSDGSDTLASSMFQATYHSLHGAVQESKHVFITAGLAHVMMEHPLGDTLRIFEFGFGTGLNAWLTKRFADDHGVHVSYYAVEAFPIPLEVAGRLNYPSVLEKGDQGDFLDLHRAEWNQVTRLSAAFELTKILGKGQDIFLAAEDYHLVYYDAFGPECQPELWNQPALGRMARSLKKGGVFVTYCAKGEVRRTLIQNGLVMERLPGPPGKREMLRGVKPGDQREDRTTI